MNHPALSAVAATKSALMRGVLTVAAIGCLAISASAQGRGPGGMGGFGGGGSVGMGGRSSRAPITSENRTPTPYSNENQGGLKLGPPGRWWDDKKFAKTIGLDSRQQKRLDDVFGGNRDTLVKLYTNLQHEESQLQKLSRSRELDEKPDASSRLTVSHRLAANWKKPTPICCCRFVKELTPEQTSRLDESLPSANQ